MKPLKDYKLCFIKDNCAYFTTQEIKEQRGDDWDFLAYEDNAGEPYEYCDTDKIEWGILKVYFECSDAKTPTDCGLRLSVDQINTGFFAWLSSSEFKIFAGDSVIDFMTILTLHGGKCFVNSADFGFIDPNKKQKKEKEKEMKVWYFDIPSGIYTTHQLMELSDPKQTYHAVYHALRRLKVESFKLEKDKMDHNQKNEKQWIWKGAESYLNLAHRVRSKK